MRKHVSDLVATQIFGQEMGGIGFVDGGRFDCTSVGQPRRIQVGLGEEQSLYWAGGRFVCRGYVWFFGCVL